LSEAIFEGYTIAQSDYGVNRNDGVLMLVCERVSATVRQVELGGVYGLSCNFFYRNKEFNLLAVYRTYDNDLDNFTNALHNFYRDTNRNKTYIFTGDVNANILRPDNQTERYLDVLYGSGL
jgi:hypothetical protein